MSGAADPRPDPAPAIEALRALGAPRLDPVRFRHLEALARRAATHQGEVRRVLDDRLAPLLAACAQAVQEARATSAQAPAPAPTRSALAELLARLDGDAAEPAGHGRPGAAPPADLKTVRVYRSTWAALGAEQRLRQSSAQVPENAGPLNTQRLLHEALTLMREVSPAYLHRLLSQVEALLWLDPARPPAAAAKKDAARPARERRPVGPRPG